MLIKPFQNTFLKSKLQCHPEPQGTNLNIFFRSWLVNILEMEYFHLTPVIWFNKITGWQNDRDGNTGIFNKNCPLRLHSTRSKLLETGQVQRHAHTHTQTHAIVSQLSQIYSLDLFCQRWTDPVAVLRLRNMTLYFYLFCKITRHVSKHVHQQHVYSIVFTISHSVSSGLLVAGGAWRIWLLL